MSLIVAPQCLIANVLPHLSVCWRHFVIIKEEVHERTLIFSEEENKLALLKLTTRNQQ